MDAVERLGEALIDLEAIHNRVKVGERGVLLFEDIMRLRATLEDVAAELEEEDTKQ